MINSRKLSAKAEQAQAQNAISALVPSYTQLSVGLEPMPLSLFW
jgi:hypothetical protein